MSVSIAFGSELPQRPPSDHQRPAFRILVIGDFGAGLPQAAPLPVDRDDIDQVMQKLEVGCTFTLNANSPPISIRLTELDDLHPDRLFNQLDIFAALKSRRHRLLNDSTWREEMTAMLEAGGGSAANLPHQAADTTAQQPPDTSGSAAAATAGSASSEITVPTGSLLSEVLSQTEAARKPLEQQILEGSFNWDAYVQQLVAPYVLEKSDPRQAQLLVCVDAAIADTMRAILHHPRFQALEAAWQGLHFMTRRLQTDRSLQLSVLNLSAEQLAADLHHNENLAQTQLCRLLIDSVSAEGAEPWSLVVGNFQFGSNAADCLTLTRLGRICCAAGTAFAAAADPSIAGCPGFDRLSDPRDWTVPDQQHQKFWTAVRVLPGAGRLCLALPRLMARRPYGADTNPIESFEFTEIADSANPSADCHHQFLWMNPAFAIACLAGQAFQQNGNRMPPSIAGEIDRLPLHWYTQDAEELLKPSAEQELTGLAAEILSRWGLTVVRSVRNQDVVRIDVVRSLSQEHPDWILGESAG